MIVRIVRVGENGLVTLPTDALRAAGIMPGTEVVLVHDGERTVLRPVDVVARVGDGRSWVDPFADVWDNAVDDAVWGGG